MVRRNPDNSSKGSRYSFGPACTRGVVTLGLPYGQVLHRRENLCFDSWCFNCTKEYTLDTGNSQENAKAALPSVVNTRTVHV